MPTVNHIIWIQKIKSKGEIESHRIKMIGERKKMRKRERKVERSTVK